MSWNDKAIFLCSGSMWSTSDEINLLFKKLFVIDGNNKTEKIKSMPNIHRLSIDLAIKEIKILKKLGIQGVALFPCIQKKYKTIDGSEAFNEDGLMQRAIRNIKKAVKDIAIISDVALDPYTTHGQDGILSSNNKILNDEEVSEAIKNYSISDKESKWIPRAIRIKSRILLELACNLRANEVLKRRRTGKE